MTSAGPPPALYAALVRAVTAAVHAAMRRPDAYTRTRALTELLAAVHEQTVAVTAERDALLIDVLAEQGRPSNRALAADLGLSRQRIDQLAAHARAGGRPRTVAPAARRRR